MELADFGKIKTRLLTCGTLLVGGTLFAGAIACPPTMAAILASGGAGLAGVAGNLLAEMVGGDLGTLAESLGRNDEILKNEDLARAVGRAIASVIAAAAESNEFHADKTALQKLAKAADEGWAELAKVQFLPGDRFAGIQETQLIKNYFSNQPKEFDQVTALTPADWLVALDWLGRIAGVKIQLDEAGKTLAGDVSGRTILKVYAVNKAAANLHTMFPKALREVLKDDFENGGKAFAAFAISMFGEISGALGSLKELSKETTEQQAEIIKRLNSLAHLTPGTPQADQAFKDLAEEVKSGFKKVLEQMGLANKSLADLLNEVRQMREDVQATRIAAEGTQKDVQKLREDIPALLQGRDPSIIPQDDPHPTVTNWQGRSEELQQLQAWLEDANVQLIGIIALGGFGKSTLAAKIYKESTGFVGKFWADVRQGSDFTRLARRAIGRLRQQSEEAFEKIQESELIGQLVKCLQDERYLLVIDNLETLLHSNGQWRDETYRDFFHLWLGYGGQSVILVTSRERPNLQEVSPHWLELPGLQPEEGGALLKSLKIQGSDTELQAFSQRVGGHPLALKLVAGLLNEEEGPNPLLSRLKDRNLFQIEGLHRGEADVSVEEVLEESFNRLTDKLKLLLLNSSVYRRPFNQAAAVVQLPGEELLEQDLRQPARRSLLQELRGQNGERLFQFHPFILTYVQQKTGNQPEAHERAINYYRSIAKEQPWQTLDDVTAYLEIFYHYCQLGQYAQAFDSIYNGSNNDCDNFLNLRGYNTVRVQLYSQLVQEWKSSDRDERWKFGAALTSLGNAYRVLGQYKKAIDCFKQSLAIAQDIGHRAREAASLSGLGYVYDYLGRYQQAIDCCQQSLAIAREIGDRSGEANALNALGNAYDSLERYQQAIDCYQQSLAIAREIGDRVREAASLGGLGNAYHSLGRYQEAIDCYQQSLAIAQEISDRRGEANALGALGNIYQSLGQYREAIEHHQQWLAIAREIGDRSGEASSLGGLGNTYQSLGQYREAIEHHQQWLAIAREIGDRSGEANSVGNLGNAYYYLGQYQQAIDYYQQSLEIKQKIGDHQGEANTLNELGNANYALGQYQQAVDDYQQSLSIAREIGDRSGEANTLGNLGLSYHALGQSQQAIEFYQQSLEIKRELGNRQGEANTLNDLGNAYYSLAQYKEAIDYYQQSLSIARELGDHSGEANTLGNLGLSYYALAQYQQAIEFYQQQLDIAREIGDLQGEANSLGNQGVAYYSLGQYQQAIEFHQQQLDIAREIGDLQGKANSLGNQGVAYQSLGQYQQAIEFHQQQLNIAREIGDRQGEAEALNGLGNVYRSLWQYQQAIEFHQRSIEMFQEISAQRGEADSLLALAHTSIMSGRVLKGLAAGQKARKIYLELKVPLNAWPLPKWMKWVAKFAQRGKGQLALCFVLGLVAFPFALVVLVALMLWRVVGA